jgi:hypothetical protein
MKELEQAAKEYCTYADSHKNAIANNAFIAGANWQSQKEGELSEDNKRLRATIKRLHELDEDNGFDD